MVTVDLMHKFLLGMVRDESAHHVADNSDVHLDCTEFYWCLNSMCVPYDYGTIAYELWL